MYESLKGFFDKVKDWLQRNNEASELESPFIEFVERLLFGTTDISLESFRSKRATATVTFLSVCQEGKFQIPDAIRQRIAEWIQEERSEPVQRILQQVQGKLSHIP